MQKQLFVEPIPKTWTPDQKLMALSWKQPYAELMLHGKIETRTWATKYRGWVLICASKSPYRYHEILNISGNIQSFRIEEKLWRRQDILLGCAIAIGCLVDCRPMRKEDEDMAFVTYRPELFCHIYEGVQSIEPISWKGTQGWKEVSKHIKSQIKIQ